jgi:hypothetical protein
MERSGKSTLIRWRYFCPKFLRQSFHEYAGESIHHSFRAKAYDMSQRARGKSHQAAVRALAFKWIRIIYKCWHTHALQRSEVFREPEEEGFTALGLCGESSLVTIKYLLTRRPQMSG